MAVDDRAGTAKFLTSETLVEDRFRFGFRALHVQDCVPKCVNVPVCRLEVVLERQIRQQEKISEQCRSLSRQPPLEPCVHVFEDTDNRIDRTAPPNRLEAPFGPFAAESGIRVVAPPLVSRWYVRFRLG